MYGFTRRERGTFFFKKVKRILDEERGVVPLEGIIIHLLIVVILIATVAILRSNLLQIKFSNNATKTQTAVKGVDIVAPDTHAENQNLKYQNDQSSSTENKIDSAVSEPNGDNPETLPVNK